MNRILVTGTAVFIGSHLAEWLLKLRYEAIGVDSFTNYCARERKSRNLTRATEEKAFRLVEGDLLEALLQGVSSVINLTAEPGVRASWGDSVYCYLERNVKATQWLLEALPKGDLERFVFASLSSVYESVEEGR